MPKKLTTMMGEQWSGEVLCKAKTKKKKEKISFTGFNKVGEK